MHDMKAHLALLVYAMFALGLFLECGASPAEAEARPQRPKVQRCDTTCRTDTGGRTYCKTVCR